MIRTITTEHNNQSVSNVNVLILYEDGTGDRYETAPTGEVIFNVRNALRPAMVFVAMYGYKAVFVEDWIPAEGNLHVEMTELPSGGSYILFDGKHEKITDLEWEVWIELDPDGGITLCVYDLGVNGGYLNPLTSVRMKYGGVVQLTDGDGQTRYVSLRTFFGKNVLLNWWSD